MYFAKLTGEDLACYLNN